VRSLPTSLHGYARPEIAILRIPRSVEMIRKLKSGKYRLYSQKKDPKTGRRKNLGTFETREAAKKHEQEVEFFKRKK
jgi:hypothetical protein